MLTCLLGASLLVLVAGSELSATRGPIAGLAQEGAAVSLHGRVAADPHEVRQTEPGPRRVTVLLTVDEVRARGTRTEVRTPVLVSGGVELLDLRWRDRVQVSGILRPADGGERVRARLVVRGGIERDPTPEILGLVSAAVRSAMREAAGRLPGDARGLVPAMVTGDRGAVPADLDDAMRATGMSHLTAVSGTNVSIVVGATIWLCGLCRVPRRGRTWVGLGVVGVFVVVAHPDPSVLRAAVMGGIGLLGLLASRRSSAMPALAGAILLLLAIDPWLARSYGFALSVLATLGLLVLAPPMAEALHRSIPRAGILAEAIAVPLAAQVACAPVVVLLQGGIPLIGIVANTLAAPLVAPITLFGSAAAVLAPISHEAARMLLLPAAAPATGVAWIARWAATTPVTLPWSNAPWAAVLLALLIVLVVLARDRLLAPVRRYPRFCLALGITGIVLALCLARARTAVLDEIGHPAVVMCDVGQGDAIVLLGEPGHAVLVDTGPEPTALDHCLDALDITTLDAVVLTHFDLDHVGGVDGIDQDRAVGEVLTSVASMNDVPPAVARWWDGRTIRSLGRGDGLQIGDVTVTVRSPASRFAASANAGSLVIEAVIGREPETAIHALLLADADAPTGASVRRDLTEHPAQQGRPFDIVKVAHHGSADHDRALLQAVAAPVALVSVGAGNRYGHPTRSALDSLAMAGSVVYRSDRDGTVAVWRQDGSLVTARTRSW